MYRYQVIEMCLLITMFLGYILLIIKDSVPIIVYQKTQTYNTGNNRWAK